MTTPTPPATAPRELAQWLEDYANDLQWMEAIGALPVGELSPMLADAAALLRQRESELATTREALRRLVVWGGFRSPSAGYNADVVLGVADWFADGMTGPLPPLPPYIASREGLDPAAASREALAEAREESQDRSQLSDGYHTFAELYEHRHALMLALMRSEPDLCWFSQYHADGGLPFGSPDWFIAGAELTTGSITYHLPARLWETAKSTGADELPVGMAWDGHTPGDVVERLKSWAAWLPASREESQAAAWQGIEPEQVLPAVEALAAAIKSTPSNDPRVQGFDVKRLANRLDELADYVTQGPDSVRRNFTMSVPARPYHDADLVLNAAASLLRDWPVAPEGAEPTTSAPALPPALVLDGGDGVRIQAANRERTSWAVRDDLSCLNSSGEWEPTPYPSSRSADFLARTRWPSAQAAWNALLGFRAAELLANCAAGEGAQS